ncbi:Protein GrpE [Candidatus Terasakiella magnetica]|uniref:Protein GrpE n=1 Tax=Candidatus Terasakiella magnetica TaxID=1867952 RepID=A0A1C3REW0_9PROT|nr:nucleotide exchange factor GrpE [Candidatus Terasakiella magnetica]SCA55826.1 Protein GrpE [Candidatus Terasakiella magnetica]
MSGENTQATPENNEEVIEETAAPQQAEAPVEETLEADVQGFAEEGKAGDRVAQLEAELAEMKSKWMRAVADEQNVRRRGEREKQDALKYGVTNFAREMVSVADNLSRAMDSTPEDMKDTDVIKGVEMTERELQNAFNKAGIKRIEAAGQPFDHNLHQAMFEIQDPSQPSGLVGQVMQDGYVIHDRLLRPAMVGVTKGGPKYEAPSEEAPADEAAAATDAYENAGAESGEKLNQET